MIIVSVLCAVYCLSMTITLGIFTFNEKIFTEGAESCFSDDNSVEPVSFRIENAVNISDKMWQVMLFGFFVHLIGFIADSSLIFRVRSQSYYYRAYSLSAVLVYTVLWIVWLIWLHVLRYTRNGLMCSGYYLDY